ncbi:MAG: DUF3450 family protein [Chitinivibrionales bacterium]|nr:DUF3450 family protein [Chitinivibrionales bacterium]
MRRYAWLLVVACALCRFGSAAAATDEELRNEIRELEARIAETDKQIEAVRREEENERREFEQYRARHAQRLAEQRAEVDTLKQTHAHQQQRADSLAEAIADLRKAKQEQARRGRVLASRLEAYCDSVSAVVASMPPGNSKAQLDAVAFLRGELAAGAVDNIEALERLWQILDALSSAAQAVEVYNGPSPVTDIAGQVDYVRLGHVYLACVDQAGEAGALWIPAADSAGEWRRIRDVARLQSLRQAVRIRQGGAVPELVDLPFDHPVAADTLAFQEGR